MEDFPEDIIGRIVQNLDNLVDIRSFSLSSNVIMKKCNKLKNLCSNEKEDMWNGVHCTCCYMRPKCNYIKRCQQCTKTEWIEFQCCAFPKLTHTIQMEYYHFPRDVDLYTTWIDGKQKGRCML